MIDIHLFEAIKAVESSKTLDELLCAAENFTRSIDFKYFAYGHRPHTPFSKGLTMLNNYPESWKGLYEDQDFAYQDPVVLHGIRCTAPLIWSAADSFDSAPQMQSSLKDFDLKVGWSQSTRSTAGTSLLTLVHCDPKIPWTEINTPYLMWFTQIFNHAVEKFIFTQPEPNHTAHLTSREIEVIRWTADGKTSYEIGLIISDTVFISRLSVFPAYHKCSYYEQPT